MMSREGREAGEETQLILPAPLTSPSPSLPSRPSRDILPFEKSAGKIPSVRVHSRAPNE